LAIFWGVEGDDEPDGGFEHYANPLI